MSLREAFNVEDLKRRDRLVRRFRKMRAEAVLEKNTLEYVNSIHPDWPPFDTKFEEAVIAWCDSGGEGPMPVPPDPRYVPRGKSESAEGPAA